MLISIHRMQHALLGVSFLAALVGCGDHLKAHGNIVDQPAPDIRLPSTGPAPFVLSAEQGKEVVLFFGYTHCGDVCPTTLSHVAQALSRLDKSKTPIEVVFISVDPKRDTPAVSARYARLFNRNFIGLSGSAQQVETVEHDYHVWSKAMPPDRSGNYEVSHSSELFLIAPDGRLRIIEDWDIPVGDLADDMHALQ